MSEGIETLSLVASKISTWADSASLCLNQKKTKAIFFGTGTLVNRINKLNYPGIDVGEGIVIPFADEVKSLGVTLDSRLTWEAHVTQIGKKINRVLYTLRFIRHCTSEALRTRLVQALIVPHLDYCSVVYLDAKKQLKTRLQRLSNSGVRYIFGIRRDSSITPYRKGLGWLCVDSRRSYFMAILIYKILRLGQPAYLSHLFTNYVPKKMLEANFDIGSCLYRTLKTVGVRHSSYWVQSYGTHFLLTLDTYQP